MPLGAFPSGEAVAGIGWGKVPCSTPAFRKKATGRHAKQRQLHGGGRPLLIFDQFEELFSHPKPCRKNALVYD